MAYHTNGSIATGGTAQDILTAGHSKLSVVIQNNSDTDMIVAVDATAAAGVGETVYAGTSATFNNLLGRRINVLGATTGKTFVIREAL